MATVSDFGAREVEVTVTIPNTAAVSGGVDLFGCDLVAIVIPAAWTAAAITFNVSPYDPLDPKFVAWSHLYKSTGNNDGYEYEIASAIVTAGACISLPEDDFVGFRFIQVCSGTKGSPVNQGADRTLTLICRPAA